jgi:hypothetical protein
VQFLLSENHILKTKLTSGLYYKSFMIIIYNSNDSTIIIYYRNDSGLYYKSFTIVNYASEEHNLGS